MALVRLSQNEISRLTSDMWKWPLNHTFILILFCANDIIIIARTERKVCRPQCFPSSFDLNYVSIQTAVKISIKGKTSVFKAS